MTERSNIHIAIIGAGLGGLCLAQRLKRQGISFAVYERDPSPDSRTQGYRIRIDETGQHALAACLPEELNLLFRRSCAVSHSGGQFLDPQLEPIDGRPAQSWRPSAVTADGGSDAVSGDRSANRQTLREVLLTGIEDRVHFGKAFARFDEREDGVAIAFDDGTVAHANIAVAADGVNSSVRRQRFPSADPVDTGAVCVYGKTVLAPGSRISASLLSGTSVIFAEGFAIIVDAMRFRLPAATQLTPVEDYLYWAVIGRRAELGLGLQGQLGGADLLATILERQADAWAPGLRALLAEATVSTVAALPVRSATALTPWAAGRVTFLGDAIHAMSPAGGVGANTALADAEALARRLAAVAAGQSSMQQAIAVYEEDMRRRANAAIAASTAGALRLLRASSPEEDAAEMPHAVEH